MARKNNECKVPENQTKLDHEWDSLSDVKCVEEFRGQLHTVSKEPPFSDWLMELFTAACHGHDLQEGSGQRHAELAQGKSKGSPEWWKNPHSVEESILQISNRVCVDVVHHNMPIESRNAGWSVSTVKKDNFPARILGMDVVVPICCECRSGEYEKGDGPSVIDVEWQNLDVEEKGKTSYDVERNNHIAGEIEEEIRCTDLLLVLWLLHFLLDCVQHGVFFQLPVVNILASIESAWKRLWWKT
mmetsp:Transcript_177/g.244  ORF Transcript_177/g.244 Transcript_177/m.244 type:complete len:243 (-) Transcript_177:32-760(-)